MDSIPRGWHRFGIACFFIMHGLCFVSWTSRIVTIQQNLGLSDSELGAVLFAMPIGLVFSLVTVNALISRIGSRYLLLFGHLSLAILLLILGYADSPTQIAIALFFSGVAFQTCNVCQNTLGVAWQNHYKTSMIGTFHGLWSLSALTGAAFGTLMIGFGVSPFKHFLIIAPIIIISAIVSFRLLPPDQQKAKAGGPAFAIPNRAFLGLAVIAFFTFICEGTMFDWSGVYFNNVVHTDRALIGLGYAVFMGFHAFSRFAADHLTSRFGPRKMIQGSCILSAMGLWIAVIFPYLIPATIGFMLVGIGVGSVGPIIYGAAGKTSSMPLSVAIAMITGAGMFGFLAGPPLIGFVAGATNLRVSFAIVASMVLLTTYLAGRSSQLS